MKITATLKDDIIRRRDEYDAAVRELEAQKEDEDTRYQEADYEATKGMEKKISDLIGPTSLSLDIRANTSYSRKFNEELWQIRIEANDRNKFDDNVSLSWNWSVEFSGLDGELRKESGSWSGLKAVTSAQIEDLKESVRVLEILNNVDWLTVLKTPVVRYSDYHDEELSRQLREKHKERPNFEEELLAANLEELVGGNTAIKLYKDEYWKGTCYIIPTGCTDKFVKGYIFPSYYIDKYQHNGNQIRDAVGEIRRTNKNNLVADKDKGEFETIELAL